MKADKGNEIVVIDRNEYKQKIEDHLSDSNTYLRIDGNPTMTQKNKVNRLLTELKQQKEISPEEY